MPGSAPLLLAVATVVLLRGAAAKVNPTPPPPPDPCAGVSCGSHGSCTSPTGTCSCTGGWSGDSCDVDPCTGYDCSGHGTCHDNKQCTCNQGWQGNSCSQPKSCGNLVPPPHTTSDCDGKKTDQTCTVTCSEAGWTKGPVTSEYTCEATGEFSGTPPTCEKVTCDAGPAVANAADCQAGTWDPTAPTVCHADCLHGYTRDGTSGALPCGINGKYSGALVCTPVPCDPFGYPGYRGNPDEPTAKNWDGYPLPWVGKNAARPKGEQPHQPCAPGTFGTKCTLTCDDGYDGSNAAPFECTVPGTAAPTPDGSKGRWSKLTVHRACIPALD